MIFGNLKNPFKDPKKIMTNTYSSTFSKKMNEICIKEITRPEEAITDYLELLKKEKFKKSEEHQKILFHLCACYERTGDLGRALYYMALSPYYYPGEDKEDFLKTYKSIVFHKATKIFRENKDRLQILIVEPDLSRLDFIRSTIKNTCYQNVYAIDSQESFKKVEKTAFIQEYDLILLSSNLYKNSEEMINAYSSLKSWAYSPFISFMLHESDVCKFRKKHPGIEYFIKNGDLKFLYAILLIILKRNN